MKTPASLKEFADDIMKDLPPSPHSLRFRDEILEHLEDAQEELERQIDNPNQIKTKIMQKIGDKATLTESFNDFHRSRFSRLWPVELIIYLFLSYCVFDVMSPIMTPYEMITAPSLQPLRLVTVIFSTLIAYVFARTVFSFVARRLSPYLNDKKNRIAVALMLMLVPVLDFIHGWAYILWYDTQINHYWEFFTSEYFIISLLKFATLFVAISVAFGIIPHRNKEYSALTTKIRYTLPLVLLALLMLCNALLARQEPGVLSAPWQFIEAMASFLELPMSLFYYLTDFVIILIASGLSIAGVDVYPLLTSTAIYSIYAISLFAIIVGGIWMIISADKAKTESGKNWKRTAGIALVGYCAFLLLPIDKARSGLPWDILAVEITKDIDQDEQGLLYPLHEYLGQGYSPYYYTICQKENIFTLVQSSYQGRYSHFLINTSDLQKGQVPEVSAAGENGGDSCPIESPLSEGMLPPGFACDDCERMENYDESGNVTSSFISNYGNLTYHGHRIFKTGNSVANIMDLQVSDNQGWASLKDESSQIYLIDLRNLK